jgi:hypothetical protein
MVFCSERLQDLSFNFQPNPFPALVDAGLFK